MTGLRHIRESRIASSARWQVLGIVEHGPSPVAHIARTMGLTRQGVQGIADILTRDGYNVSVVQQPETSFADDVKETNRQVEAQDGDTVLVGHSYGGLGAILRLQPVRRPVP